MKKIAEKMGIKDGYRGLIVNGPTDAVEAIKLPDIAISKRLSGTFDYIHFFVTRQSDFKKKFAQLKKYLRPTGALWVSWPKGGQLNTDLSLTKVIELGYDKGLVESTSLRINNVWSALKFTHPRKGKIYRNSYGTLKQ